MITVVPGPESRRFAPPLNSSDLRMLARAVAALDEWRGSLVGNPYTTDLGAQDKAVIKAKQALRRAKALAKWVDDCEFPRAPK